MDESPMFTIYHNPRCSKSRQTLALLQDKGITPDIALYLTTPPTPEQLHSLVKALGVPVRDIIRTQEQEYRDLNLADPSLSETALMDAICRHPKLLERPIVTNGSQAIIGRPPENVLSLIKNA